MANEQNLKPFKQGDDERRNLKGRPKNLPKLDVLLVEVLGNEDDDDSEAKKILAALLKEAKSGNTKAAEILLDRAYGKSAQTLDLTTKGESINPTPIKFTKGSNG